MYLKKETDAPNVLVRISVGNRQAEHKHTLEVDSNVDLLTLAKSLENELVVYERDSGLKLSDYGHAQAEDRVLVSLAEGLKRMRNTTKKTSRKSETESKAIITQRDSVRIVIQGEQ